MSVTSAGLRNLSLVAVCGQLRKRRGRAQPRSAQKATKLLDLLYQRSALIRRLSHLSLFEPVIEDYK